MSNNEEALARLRERLQSRSMDVWLQGARVERVGSLTRLHVGNEFQRRRLEERCMDDLVAAFGTPVEVVAATSAARARRTRTMPRLQGPAGEFAVRMVRALVSGEFPAPLLVVHGPPRSGKSVLVDWACALGAGGVFRLDLARVRRGHSRGLVPRKPLVVADGLEILGGRDRAQRTLCTIIDAVLGLGHRLLCAVEGHPAGSSAFLPPLRSRLLGGVLVPVEAATARRTREPAAAPPEQLERMKDAAARLFGVERALLNGPTKRRRVVEARRTVIAVACRRGLEPRHVAAAFELRSERALKEACRWAEQEQARDRRYAALLHEVGRVLPGT